MASLQTPPRYHEHEATEATRAACVHPDRCSLLQRHPQHPFFPAVYVDAQRERHRLALCIILRWRAPRTHPERRAGARRRAGSARVGRRRGTGAQWTRARGRSRRIR